MGGKGASKGEGWKEKIDNGASTAGSEKSGDGEERRGGAVEGCVE